MNVINQYHNDKNLSTRINFHIKYSTNKTGWFPWLFEHYKFKDGCRILELGCGNGSQWANQIEKLPSNCILVLSDFSEGMVNLVRDHFVRYPNVLAAKIDIQNIPFPDDSFDIVIANHMLYHVPDIDTAISEVRRVLRSDGKFYTSTNGNGGMTSYLYQARKQVNPTTSAISEGFSFSLQNGAAYLNKYFSSVQCYQYDDSLFITETQDLINWMKSNQSISNFAEDEFDKLYDYFEAIRLKHGAIVIPKELGLFVSQNPMD